MRGNLSPSNMQNVSRFKIRDCLMFVIDINEMLLLRDKNLVSLGLRSQGSSCNNTLLMLNESSRKLPNLQNFPSLKELF